VLFRRAALVAVFASLGLLAGACAKRVVPVVPEGEDYVFPATTPGEVSAEQAGALRAAWSEVLAGDVPAATRSYEKVLKGRPRLVPAETGLAALEFNTPTEKGEGAYVTPDAPDSPFRAPGPVAGPFTTTLGDGSTVTYCWYRFADQPAMLNAGLTPAEREEAQRRVELIHRAWTKDRAYLPAPTTGRLASLDPALIVVPPKGFEVGYVPIAIRQGR